VDVPTDRCPECLLTPQAAELLERLHQKLQRTRPGDPNWHTRICPHCGRLTGISDDVEGWSLGEAVESGWSTSSTPVTSRTVAPVPVADAPRPEPQDPGPIPALVVQPARPAVRPAPEPRPIGDDEVPTWVTVREAAFLSSVTEDTILDWVGRDVVAHEQIQGGDGDPRSMLVRTSDLDAALADEAS
jgi:hypothetical protein